MGMRAREAGQFAELRHRFEQAETTDSEEGADELDSGEGQVELEGKLVHGIAGKRTQ